jgi:hypothetical protein
MLRLMRKLMGSPANGFKERATQHVHHAVYYPDQEIKGKEER